MHQAAAAKGQPASLLTWMSSSWLFFTNKNKDMVVVNSISADLLRNKSICLS
jgi:hypothetical protein